jgi:hypothetical protein
VAKNHECWAALLISSITLVVGACGDDGRRSDDPIYLGELGQALCVESESDGEITVSDPIIITGNVPVKITDVSLIEPSNIEVIDIVLVAPDDDGFLPLLVGPGFPPDDFPNGPWEDRAPIIDAVMDPSEEWAFVSGLVLAGGDVGHVDGIMFRYEDTEGQQYETVYPVEITVKPDCDPS